MAAASASASPTGTRSAPSPHTSGSDPARVATTGTPGAHGLDRRQAEALVDATGRRTRPRRPAGRPGRSSSTQPSRTMRSRWAAVATAAVERLGPPAVGARPPPGAGRGRRRPGGRTRATRVGRSLRGSTVPDGQHVPVAAGQRAARPRVARGRRPRAPWWMATTRSGSAPKCGDDLVAHELGRGVDPGAPPQRPSEQAGVRQGELVGQLGEAQRGQVVDGHDARRARVGGHDEVGAPDDVVPPDPAVDERVVGAPPRLVQRTGRHRPVDDPHRGGHHVAQAATAPPRDGEGGELEVVAAGQALDEGTGHHAHAGQRRELRGEVDGDAQQSGQ